MLIQSISPTAGHIGEAAIKNLKISRLGGPGLEEPKLMGEIINIFTNHFTSSHIKQ